MSAASKPTKARKGATKGELEEPTKRADDEDAPAEATEDAETRSSETPYRGSSPGGHSARKPPTIWQKVTWRWTAVTAVLAVVLLLFTYHPYYRNNAQFTPFRTVFTPAFFIWLCFGVFYIKATLEKFHERRYLMRDAPLHLVLLGSRGFENVLSSGQWYVVSACAGIAALLGVARSASFAPGLRTFAQSNGGSAILYLSALFAIGLLTRGLRPKRIWRLVKNRRIKTTLLAVIVKGFFTPLMTGFVVGHLNGISRAWLAHKHLPPINYTAPHGADLLTQLKGWWALVSTRLPDLVPSGSDFVGLVTPWTWTRADLSWGLGFTYDCIFAVDCGFALIGYASESRWLGNKTKSVEPTAFGWLVCISCYPPFNNVLGTYLPLEAGPRIIHSETTELVLRAGVVFLFAIYAAATVAFGFKFSNLTNRGIISRGPYKYVRHPAYLCKCSAWWLENIPTMTLTKAFFLTLLCGWYALRAWTEERHLSMDPEYLAYKKKTPWVIFPGVY